MGQSSSSAMLPAADPRVPYFALTFQSPDKLTLALADESIIDMTKQAISESISSEEDYHHDTFVHFEGRTDINSYEIKFRDYPFMRGCSDPIYLRCQRMCCYLLETYREHGWTLDLSSDLSRGKEMTTWFFQKNRSSHECGSSSVYGRRKNVLCISITTGDTIQLVNGPQRLRRVLAQAVRQGYAADVIKRESVTCDEGYEIQLIDQPWLSRDPAITLRVRRLILEIIRLFETEGGYRFYGMANANGTFDTLFFIEVDEESDQLLNDRLHFAISLNSGSCVTVLDAPSSDVAEAVLRAVVRYWPGKLISQTMLDGRGTHELRLKGSPWYASGGDEATAARVFICGLLETLRIDGYDALAALDVTRGLNDKALLIFRSRHAASEIRSPQQKAAFLLKESSKLHWCISLQDEFKVRLINAPDALRLAIRHAVDQIWPWGIQREHRFFNDEGYVFKLGAGPWGSEQHQNVAALMSYILKVLNDQGCRAVISADVTGRYIANNHGGSHSLDLHSWFLTCRADMTQHKSQMPPVVKRKEERSYSTAAEIEEADEELTLLKPIGGKNQRADRPVRKISAVEYTSYVVNAANRKDDCGSNEATDIVKPLLVIRPDAPKRKTTVVGHRS